MGKEDEKRAGSKLCALRRDSARRKTHSRSKLLEMKATGGQPVSVRQHVSVERVTVKRMEISLEILLISLLK